MTSHESQPTEPTTTEYYYVDQHQLKYLERAASDMDTVEITIVPTDTPEQIDAIAREWSQHEENTYYLDTESAFDYIRRTERTSYERLLQSIPEMTSLHYLIKDVTTGETPNRYRMLINYYEPTEPKPQEEQEYDKMMTDLWRTFEQGGHLRYRYEIGYQRLCYQIAHDNPVLSKMEVVRQAWSLIPEVIQHQPTSTPEELAMRAIFIHEQQEAERRVSE